MTGYATRFCFQYVMNSCLHSFSGSIQETGCIVCMKDTCMNLLIHLVYGKLINHFLIIQFT